MDGWMDGWTDNFHCRCINYLKIFHNMIQNGKKKLQTTCTSCHPTNTVLNIQIVTQPTCKIRLNLKKYNSNQHNNYSCDQAGDFLVSTVNSARACSFAPLHMYCKYSTTTRFRRIFLPNHL